MKGFLDIFLSKQKKNASASIYAPEGRNFFDFSYTNLISEFSRNTVAYRCVNLISNNVCAILLGFCQEENFSNLKINCVPVKPNELQTWHNLWEQVIFSLLVTGNAFLLKEEKGFVFLDSRYIKFVYEKSIFICFEYEKDKKKQRIEYKSLIHFKLPNPNNDFFGLSPTSVGFFEIKKHNAISDLIMDITKSGCRPSGIFSYEGDEKNIKASFSDFSEKVNKGGSIIFVQGPYKWEPIGMTPQEIEISKRLEEAALSIAQIYGVPPCLIGLSEKNYNGMRSYQESSVFFFKTTVNPLAQLIFNTFMFYDN